jgi:hypothetical protein
MNIGTKLYLTGVTNGVETGLFEVSVFKKTYKSFKVYTKDHPEMGRIIFDLKTFAEQIIGQPRYKVYDSKKCFKLSQKSANK